MAYEVKGASARSVPSEGGGGSPAVGINCSLPSVTDLSVTGSLPKVTSLTIEHRVKISEKNSSTLKVAFEGVFEGNTIPLDSLTMAPPSAPPPAPPPVMASPPPAEPPMWLTSLSPRVKEVEGSLTEVSKKVKELEEAEPDVAKHVKSPKDGVLSPLGQIYAQAACIGLSGAGGRYSS